MLYRNDTNASSNRLTLQYALMANMKMATVLGHPKIPSEQGHGFLEELIEGGVIVAEGIRLGTPFEDAGIELGEFGVVVELFCEEIEEVLRGERGFQIGFEELVQLLLRCEGSRDYKDWDEIGFGGFACDT